MRLLPCFALLAAGIVACSPSSVETATSAPDEITEPTAAAAPPTGMSPESLVCMVTLSRYAEALHNRIQILEKMEVDLLLWDLDRSGLYWDHYAELHLAESVLVGNFERVEQDCPTGFGYDATYDTDNERTDPFDPHEGVAADDVGYWLRQIAVADLNRTLRHRNHCLDSSPPPGLRC